MTEQEWLASDDPKPMLTFLAGRESARQLRCFALAGGRRFCHIWEESAEAIESFRRVKLHTDAFCQRLLDTAERIDGGLAVDRSLADLWLEADRWFEVDFDYEKEETLISLPLGLRWDLHASIRGDAAHWIMYFEDHSRSPREQASQDARQLRKFYGNRSPDTQRAERS